MANFESSVKVIPYSQERVYAKLSDLSNLEMCIRDRTTSYYCIRNPSLLTLPRQILSIP